MRRALAPVLILLAGCATTDVRGLWVADDLPRSLGRTLVVGLSPEATWTRSMEDRMAAALRHSGVEAVALTSVERNGFRTKTADESLKDIDEIVAREGFDDVLVVHLSGTELDIDPYPVRPYIGFAPWWGSAWGSYWWGPGFSAYPWAGFGGGYSVSQTWRVEARLFEAGGERNLIWSMVLTTEEEPFAAIPEIAETTVDQLRKVKLVPRTRPAAPGS